MRPETGQKKTQGMKKKVKKKNKPMKLKNFRNFCIENLIAQR